MRRRCSSARSARGTVSVGANFRFGHGARGRRGPAAGPAGVRDRRWCRWSSTAATRSPRAGSGSWSPRATWPTRPSCSARPYTAARARSCPGDARGRELGMPTANLAPPRGRGDPRGGHLRGARARREVGSDVPAAVSIGVRPTFEDGRRSAGRGAPDRLRRRSLRARRCASRSSSACATRCASIPPRSWCEQMKEDVEQTREAVAKGSRAGRKLLPFSGRDPDQGSQDRGDRASSPPTRATPARPRSRSRC